MTGTTERVGVAALATDIRSGRRSAVDIAQMYLNRLASVNRTLNAVIADRPGDAIADAAEVDRVVANGGEPGPLAGVPFTVKDVIAVDGLATTCGSRAMRTHRTGVEATAVRRLRAAGAVLLGKTNTPEFAFGIHTWSPLFGTTHNPNGPFTIGGSSGGEAAAVASGISAFGIGTDFGGSLRWPAQCAELIGVRPGIGTVPGDGQLPEPEPSSLQELVQVIGPLTRCAADAALVLSVLAGRDPRDDEMVRRAATRDLTHVEVAWATSVAGLPVHPEVRAAVRIAADRLAGVGADVSRGAPDVIDAAAELYSAMRAADPLTRIRHLAEVQDDAGRPVISEFTRKLVHRAPAPDPERMDRLIAERLRLCAELERWLHGRRVLLLPVALKLPGPAPCDNAIGDSAPAFELLAPSRAISLFGVPSVSVPVGCTPAGLPVSVQVITPAGTEGLALAAAGVIQNAEVPS